VFDGRFRSGVDKVVKPVGSALERTGVSPDVITGLGLALAVTTAWAIASGRLGLGLGLLITSAVLDVLDGAVAKASGRSSMRGAFFDSVCDRVADMLVLGAVAWYMLDRYHGHIALLPVAVLGVSFLVSYERARAESLGFSAKGGLMERAERIVVLCAALAFSFVMIPLLWFMLALTSLTAVQRFVMVWRQANRAGHGPPPAERRVFARRGSYDRDPAALGSLAMSARWRAWREANGWVPRADRYAEGSRRTGATVRWHERRQARLARMNESNSDRAAATPFRRRTGTRRP
jgi:CDP-diacylglycerol--glycerol-3-phosphate 3-phosphatidyltransferase